MKAALIAGKGLVELREVPKPSVGPEEILVRMRACGVCGTDIEKVHGEHITPPVLGHEVAGVVEQVGRQVQAFNTNDRVAVHHHISCKSCFYCKNGLETLCGEYPRSNLDPCGFAEYCRVSETLVRGGTVYKLPDTMSFEDGSQVEPTACCIRALRKAAITSGDSVAVFGAGPVGLTHIQLLKLYGVAPIVAFDLLDSRRKTAAEIGADVALDPSSDSSIKQLADLTDGRGVDYAIVATASVKAIQQAVNAVRKGGIVLLFGAPPRGALVSLDASQLFLNETRVQSSYSACETEMRIALELISSRRLNVSKLVTHRFPLERIADAFQLAETGHGAMKVIVEGS